MADSFQKLKDLNLSRDEMERLGQALKKDEFRKLFAEYVQEIQDPANKKIYEEEIVQLEKERGMDVTFIHPKPGYVIKTSVDGNKKCFINVCANDKVQKPSSEPQVNKEGNRGLQWALPHTLAPPRDDMDHKGERCKIFDIVFHPDTIHLTRRNKAFHKMVTLTACDAVESNFGVTLDRKNLKFPKSQYKGVPHAAVVRKQSNSTTEVVQREGAEKELYDKIYQEMDAASQNSKPVTAKKTKKSSACSGRKNAEENPSYTTPKYVIKHRSHVDIQEFLDHKEAKLNAATPKELIVEINLPLLKASADLTLDVTEKTIELLSEKPSKYKLSLTLPYRVNQDQGNAKFDKDMKKLIVVLPVKQNKLLGQGDSKDDSGVDSDHNPVFFNDSEQKSPKSVSEITQEFPRSSDLKSAVPNTSDADANSTSDLDFRTTTRSKFLDSSLYYSLPDFTCHLFGNTLAFTLNVKNVDEKSVCYQTAENLESIHLKFASVSSSFYAVHYAFYVNLPLHRIRTDGVSVETWDNNVIVQISYEKCDNEELKYYFYGLHRDSLVKKYLEEPSILNSILEDSIAEEETSEPGLLQGNLHEVTTEAHVTENNHGKSVQHNERIQRDHETEGSKNAKSKAIDILGTSYESSGDEFSTGSFSPSKSSGGSNSSSGGGKGILKRLALKNRPLMGRSISESSLDDYACCSSSFEGDGCAIPEVEEEMSTSLKKTVRFNDVITRQLFRSNSSILGQKKKNQRKAKNKKKAQERRHSESEASEVDETTKKDEENELLDDSKTAILKRDRNGGRDENISLNTSEKNNNCDNIFDMDDMVF